MKLKKIFSLENLEKKIKNIWDRFPLSVIIALIVATIFFILLHFTDNDTGLWKKLLIANLSLIATFIFSIWVYLSVENTDFSKIKKNIFQLIPIVFGILFFFTFTSDIDNIENIIFFILSLVWITSYLFFAPYIKNIFLPLVLKGDVWKTEGLWIVKQSVFYTYFYNISVVILISFIFALVLFALWAIWITATNTLFDLDISEKKTYWNWAIIVFSLLSPLFLLFNIPDKKSFLSDKFNWNAFFSFLVKFVAVPFIYLYFFILYAYSIKVLANFWDWPKGEISWLVIGFSIFWYLTYSFSYIFEKDSKAIKLFRKIFPYAVIPQIFMLFYAIYLRIAQYDLTVNRYFIVIFGLWLLVISLHFVFSKKKSLIALPISLAFFIILISIIPKFNVYNYPVERQFDRLENNLEKAWIFKPEKPWTEWLDLIVPLKNYSDISKDLSKNIYSGIDYICDFDNCNKIKDLFPKIYWEILEKDKKQWEKNIQEQINKILKNKDKKECKYNKNWFKKNYNTICFDKKRLEKLKNKKYNWPSKWEIVSKITKKIKVENYFKYWLFDNQIPKINIFWSYDVLFPLEIDWYKKVFKVWTNDRVNYWEENVKNKIYWKIDILKQKLYIYENTKLTKTIDLKNVFDEIKNRYNKKYNSKNWAQKDLTFIINKNYKIIFQTIRIPKNLKDIKKKDDIYYYDMYWVILEK